MHILYAFASSFFPYGSAASTRALSYTRLFGLYGWTTHIVTDYTLEDIESGEVGRFGSHCTFQSVNKGLNTLKTGGLKARLANPRVSIKYIEKYLKENKVDVVITSAANDRFLKLRRICNKHNVPLILDITEWYDVASVKLGKYNPFYFNYTKTMEKDFMKADAFIGISRLLQKHFAKSGKASIRVPTILDTEGMLPALETHNDKIRIVYVGFSGRDKERFENILEALVALGDKKYKFELHIYGTSHESFVSRLGEKASLLTELDGVVAVKGRVEQTKVHDVYCNADYSIFIRPPKHSNQAGFPTKLAESMVAGTPVICNDTGDVGLYVKNEESGFLLNSGSVEELTDVFINIDKKTAQERKTMRLKAREIALDSFNYRSYIAEVMRLISGL